METINEQTLKDAQFLRDCLKERIESYGRGWCDGAYGYYNLERKDDKDYALGYEDGTQSFRQAMNDKRKQMGCPLTSETM